MRVAPIFVTVISLVMSGCAQYAEQAETYASREVMQANETFARGAIKVPCATPLGGAIREWTERQRELQFELCGLTATEAKERAKNVEQ